MEDQLAFINVLTAPVLKKWCYVVTMLDIGSVNSGGPKNLLLHSKEYIEAHPKEAPASILQIVLVLPCRSNIPDSQWHRYLS